MVSNAVAFQIGKLIGLADELRHLVDTDPQDRYDSVCTRFEQAVDRLSELVGEEDAPASNT